MRWILTEELSSVPVKVTSIKIAKSRAGVRVLPNILPLFVGGEGGGRDARGAVRVVIEDLRDRAAGIRHDVG